VGEALTMIGLSCLDHALSNERAINAGDAEGVHQMRVGLRRLRAAISVFKQLLPGAETDAVKRELKWLTDQLGPARDLNVLIEERVRPLQQSGPFGDEAGVLADDLQRKQNSGLDRARGAIHSDRYRAIGLRTALWLADGEWTRKQDEQHVALRERRAVEFAVEVLARRTKKVLKKLERIEEIDPPRRHKLRIAAKKLRYACEFFAGLFDGRKPERQRQRFVATLKTIQSALGKLNDIEVHKKVAARIAHRRTPTTKQAETAFAIGFVAGEEQQLIKSCVAAARTSGHRLAKLPPFWR
jgi:triphosphatase